MVKAGLLDTDSDKDGWRHVMASSAHSDARAVNWLWLAGSAQDEAGIEGPAPSSLRESFPTELSSITESCVRGTLQGAVPCMGPVGSCMTLLEQVTDLSTGLPTEHRWGVGSRGAVEPAVLSLLLCHQLRVCLQVRSQALLAQNLRGMG